MWRWGSLLVIVGCTGSNDDVGADETDDIVVTKTDTDIGPCTNVWNRPVVVDEAADLEALSGVCEITGDLSVRMPALTDLTGLESLQVVGGGLFIEGNSALTNLDGLSHQTEEPSAQVT